MKKILLLCFLLCSSVFGAVETERFNGDSTGTSAQWHSVPAPALPVREGWQVSETSGGDLTVVAPSGITAGELLLILAACDDPNNDAYWDAAPTDWIKLSESGNDVADVHVGLFYKIATGSEGNVTLVGDEILGVSVIAWYARYSGASTTEPFAASSFSNSTGDADPHGVTGLTPLRDSTVNIYLLAFDGADGDPFSVSGGNGTGFAEIDEEDIGFGGNGLAACWGSQNIPYQNTASGTATVDCNASDGAAFFQVAIQGTRVATHDIVSDDDDATFMWVNATGLVHLFIAEDQSIDPSATVDSAVVRVDACGVTASTKRIKSRVFVGSNFCDGSNTTITETCFSEHELQRLPTAPNGGGTCGNTWSHERIDSVMVQISSVSVPDSLKFAEVYLDVYYTSAGGAPAPKRRRRLLPTTMQGSIDQPIEIRSRNEEDIFTR